ncbi:MAG TPA: chemotaxis protein CheX, partial [bacterium]|nr:chemotaxis protein CheX [bacterium]
PVTEEVEHQSWRPWITASVTFSNPWHCRIQIELSLDLAAQLAAALVRSPNPVADPELWQDAAGELANMVAGNLKPFIPNALRYSVPRVVLGSGSAGRRVFGPSLDRTFVLAGHPMRVVVTDEGALDFPGLGPFSNN